MKKLVVCMMLMLCVASASAQWSVTPEVGMNVTTYENTPAKIGFKAGAAVAYTFGDGLFSLQSGLYYVQRGTGKVFSGEMYGTSIGEDGKPYDTSIHFHGNGSSYMIYGYSGYGNGYNNDFFSKDMTVNGVRMYEGSSRKDYLQLPVMARFNWKIGDDVRLHLAAGPYVALGIGGKVKYTEVDRGAGFNWHEKSSSYSSFGKNNYNSRRFDWGATLNTGIEVKRFAFNVGYDLGLGKTYKHDDISMKYQTVSFTVGYRF